jgi:hypothetical protein
MFQLEAERPWNKRVSCEPTALELYGNGSFGIVSTFSDPSFDSETYSTILNTGLFCFITGAWSILAQILIYIWLQESSQTQIGLSVIGAFSILPFAAYILAPMFNAWKGRNKDADVESNSPRTSHRTSTLDQLPSPLIPPASPIMSSMYTRERQISTVASLKGPTYR